jgi:4-amino-4-deoxy-L-arabinose transferase-like glycosyltransferase
MTEREWREASDLRPSRIGLASVLVAAAVLRFWALGHGIPYSVGVDEPEVLERAVNMMKSGSLHPRFFDYPSLYMYVQMAVACARFMIGAMGGLWGSLDQAGPEEFYLWGRAATALFGTATVLLVFQIGMRWGARHALLAAGLMAVLPQHVRESHYVLTDVPLTFFVTLTLLLSLRAHERGTVSAFAWAGAAAGLATATKYNGALALLMPLVACWMTIPANPSRLACALGVFAACGAAFLIAAPYSILDLPGFLNGFARLANEYRTKPGPGEPPAILYLKYLRGMFSWPAMLLIGVGLLLALNRLVRGPGRVRWALVTAFPLLYYFVISDQRLVFGRYLLPMTPALCVLVATAVISGVSLLRRYEVPRAPRTALIAALTIAALLPPTIQAISFDRDIGRSSTVELAHDWIRENIPRGAVIAIETRVLLLSPEGYRSQNFTRLISDSLTHAPRTSVTYAAEGYQYLIASSQQYGPAFDKPRERAEDYQAYAQLFRQGTELVRFTPSREHPGPELRIFKLTPAPPASPSDTGR